MARAYVALALVALVLGGCSGLRATIDPCAGVKRFKELDYRPKVYDSLPRVEVGSLSPAVREALAARLRAIRGREYLFEILDARTYRGYILITINEGCADCQAWFAYSPTYGCVVGRFTLFMQG
jgi:hypothetical protein